jgi:hypothetical protein
MVSDGTGDKMAGEHCGFEDETISVTGKISHWRDRLLAISVTGAIGHWRDRSLARSVTGVIGHWCDRSLV